MLLEIESKFEDSIGLIILKGILDISTIEIFNNNFNNVPDVNEISIDFGNVEFVDSTGISGLIKVLKKFQKNNTYVKIKNIPIEIFDVFKILGLIDIFGEDVFEAK